MLAELSGIGETYYRNIFLAVFNMPPAHYIQLYRVGKAKELLLNKSEFFKDNQRVKPVEFASKEFYEGYYTIAKQNKD